MAKYGPIPIPIEDRFWPKVRKTASCWLWRGGTNGVGYGMILKGRSKVLAHRVSWEMEHGSLDPKARVLHRCDNPACVRPDHLFLGTMKDNMQDMLKKGRNKFLAHKGEANGQSKLSDLEVRELREKAAADISQNVLAKEYEISQSSVAGLVLGYTRVSAGGPIRGPREVGARRAHVRKLTDEQVRTMREDYSSNNATQTELADHYDISSTRVHQIVTWKAWKHVQ